MRVGMREWGIGREGMGDGDGKGGLRLDLDFGFRDEVDGGMRG